MAFGAPFGGDATQFGGLPPEVLAALQQLQAQQQAAQADPQQAAPVASVADAGPGSPNALLFNRAPMGGGLNPFVVQDAGPATTGATPDPNVPVAMTEADTRQMERAMMPRERVAPAPTPVPPVQGMNPDRTAVPGVPGVPAQPSVTAASTGNADASNVQPVNSFDPLTGQPVSGNPKPMRAPGEGGPTEGAGRVAAAAGVPQAAGQTPNLLERFAKGLNNPEVGNLLLNVGIGLMSQRGFGPGIAAGLQGYQASRTGDLKQQLQLLQIQQQLQGQNAIRSALKAKGVPDAMIEAAALNPTVLSSVLAQQNKDPQTFNIGGHTYLGRPDQPQETWKDLGATAGPPSGYQPGQNGGLGYIPGGPEDPEVKKRIAEATRADKPQIVKMKDEQGQEHAYVVSQDENGVTTFTAPKGVSEGGGKQNPFAGTGKQTGDQAKAAGFSDRMFGSEPILRKFEDLNSSGLPATIAEHLPNGMKSTERQQMEQAQRDFINAQLRRESGAAISEGEFANARMQYFPQPGDKPEVIAQKRANRQSVITAMAREGGPSYQPPAIFGDRGEIVPFGQRAQQQAQPAPAPAPSQTPFSREDMLAEAKRRGLIK